ncbi:anion transporter [Pseudanabaenaceae cyanobacterium LEGE 13415]|nr:anion transporter [Pseudanabaenaceae cyanobacterium LEGE 13415]
MISDPKGCVLEGKLSEEGGETVIRVEYFVIAIAYFGLALGYLPGLRMNRASIALVSAGLLISLKVLTLRQAWDAIDSQTIVFLLSSMIVNASLAQAGFFQIVIARLLSLTRSPFGLMVMLTVGSGILSALVLNDTIALIFTPLILDLTSALGLNPIPYLLAMAGATNIGSVATLSGNPQNILIGSFSKISYLDFARSLIPISIVGLIIQIGLIWLLYPEVRSTTPLEGFSSPKPRIYKPLLIKTVIITGALFIAFILGFPLAESALFAASLLLISRRIKPDRLLQPIDWNLLVMFSGLFILTQATQQLNLTAPLTRAIDTPEKLLGITAILSNLVSNVPAVLLIHPLIQQSDTQSWLRLAASSTLAGNLTIFGSVANLIMIEAAARLGYRLSFLEHLRFGLPLTLITLFITYLWIQ